MADTIFRTPELIWINIKIQNTIARRTGTKVFNKDRMPSDEAQQVTKLRLGG